MALDNDLTFLARDIWAYKKIINTNENLRKIVLLSFYFRFTIIFEILTILSK